jgi:hypothetical protein
MTDAGKFIAYYFVNSLTVLRIYEVPCTLPHVAFKKPVYQSENI